MLLRLNIYQLSFFFGRQQALFSNFQLLISSGSGRFLRLNTKMLVGLFHHINTGIFLRFPLKCGKCSTSHIPITPGESPATIGKWEEQDSQPIRNKERKKHILVGPRVRKDTGERKVETR
jgi:hypothetical protein